MAITSRPIQVGGEMSAWRSADGAFQVAFLRLEPGADQFPRPGVVILCDELNMAPVVYEVKDVQRELGALKAKHPELSRAYWASEADAGVRKDAAAKLGKRPVFVG